MNVEKYFMLVNLLRRVVRLFQYLVYFIRFHHATMVFPFDYLLNLLLVSEAISRPQLEQGAIVECGTWRGGMAAGLMKVGGVGRKYYFFDSFQGLPAPQQIDGSEALAWASNPEGSRYFNNCTADEGEFIETMRGAGFERDSYTLVRGFYAESLPNVSVSPISVLRLDSDWYASTMDCLEALWPHVLPGGLIILDDYYQWAGCRKAIHTFLARYGCSEAIRSSAGAGFAYIWKAHD